MKAETCCCSVLLINYFACNKVMLDYKIIYVLLIVENTKGMTKLTKSPRNLFL